MVGIFMTQAKMQIDVLGDGFEVGSGDSLVKITKGDAQYFESYVRLPSGPCDLRARARWAPGWEAKVTVAFDADFLTAQDITNLMMRAGKQVGILEGRPSSKKSAGCGWGLFELELGAPKKIKKEAS
jgi:hypothetical protein